VEVSTSGICSIVQDFTADPEIGALSFQDDKAPISEEFATRAYQRCAQERNVSYERAPMSSSDGRPAYFERMMLPYIQTNSDTVVIVELTQLSDDEPRDVTVATH